MWYVLHHALHNSRAPLCMLIIVPLWMDEEWSSSLCQVNVSHIQHWMAIPIFVWWNQTTLCPPSHKSIKTLCSWIRLRGHCYQNYISTFGNSLKLQECWIMVFNSGPTSQQWPLMHNLHEGLGSSHPLCLHKDKSFVSLIVEVTWRGPIM